MDSTFTSDGDVPELVLNKSLPYCDISTLHRCLAVCQSWHRSAAEEIVNWRIRRGPSASLVEKVIPYLDYDTLHRCLLVSRRWYRIAADEIDERDKNLNKVTVMELVQGGGSVYYRKIDLKDNEEEADISDDAEAVNPTAIAHVPLQPFEDASIPSLLCQFNLKYATFSLRGLNQRQLFDVVQSVLLCKKTQQILHFAQRLIFTTCDFSGLRKQDFIMFLSIFRRVRLFGLHAPFYSVDSFDDWRSFVSDSLLQSPCFQSCIFTGTNF